MEALPTFNRVAEIGGADRGVHPSKISPIFWVDFVAEIGGAALVTVLCVCRILVENLLNFLSRFFFLTWTACRLCIPLLRLLREVRLKLRLQRSVALIGECIISHGLDDRLSLPGAGKSLAPV